MKEKGEKRKVALNQDLRQEARQTNKQTKSIEYQDRVCVWDLDVCFRSV